DVCAALDFSHRHGIVHRDVKPANVMITKTGAVKVMDFGIARAVADGQAQMTQTAAVIGTAQYLSPEQARGESVDARSDVYAAGCVLFELLTGEPPFTGDSPVAVAYQHVREDPKPPSSLNPRVNPALDAIVLKAMAKNPANRYQSSAEMRGDLVRVLSGQRPAAPQVMTEADRTSLMGQGRTEVIPGGGRHRPDMLDEGYDDYDPDEEDRLARRRRAWIISAVVLGIILVIVLAIWLVPKLFGAGNTGSSTAKVPSLQGLQLNLAEQKLTDVGLNWKIVTVPCGPPTNGGQPACTADDINRVLSTNPNANTPVPSGTQVTLNIGATPGPQQVPDVSGLSLQDATAKLQALGFQVAQSPNPQTTTDSNKVNTVVPNSQSPAGNTSAPYGSTVTITLYSQPQTVQVKDVVGQMYDQARQALQSQNLVVKKTNVASADPAGTVEQQNPPGGTTEPVGTTITLSVSDGTQATFSMPPLQGDTVSQAQAALHQLGWTGTFSTNYQSTFNPTKDGTISDQQQAPGSPVQQNATIGITVLQFGGTPTSNGNGGGGGGNH
ncbi:MAG TPA: PASTA domain-containing protein, partial [Pseudonocardiaceae bacterium]|nr:PASTA domain-containing protein [Pseudonocardiaceae bacterium]